MDSPLFSESIPESEIIYLLFVCFPKIVRPAMDFREQGIVFNALLYFEIHHGGEAYR